MEIPQTLGDRLRSAMKRANVRNQAVADVAGVHVKTVSKWLSDSQVPDAAALDAAAGLLRVSSSWLRYGDPIPTMRTSDASDAWGAAFREGRRSALRELRAWLESEEKRLGPET